MRHEEVYKHLGVWVRADAGCGAVFRKVKGKVAHAMQRLRAMHGGQDAVRKRAQSGLGAEGWGRAQM